MLRMIIAATALALINGATANLPPLTDEFEASSPPAAAKSDRLDLHPTGAACSQRAWPYYESNCVRDPMQPAGQAREVRVVFLDRLPGESSQTGK